MPRTLWDIAPQLGLRVRDHGDGPRISLTAREEGGAPVTLRHSRVPGLIGNGLLPLDALTSWAQPPVDLPLAQDEIARRLAAGRLVDRLSALQLAFSVEPESSLPALVNGYLMDRLRELAGGTMHIVGCSHELYISQIAFARLLIRAESFPGLIDKATAEAQLLEGGIGLMSSDAVGGGIYLVPAVSATSPIQLGAVAHRGAGGIVLLFPEPIRSPEDRYALNLADLHRPHFFTVPRQGLTVIGRAQPGDAQVFLSWWIEQWNRVLAELLDPSTHRAIDGTFDPYLMLGRFLTHQRLLACVQSILVDSGREEFTRMELLFEALDLMEGLGGGIRSWDQLATPSTVELELERLKSALLPHPEVAHVVMERCERGVEALGALRDGFRDNQSRDAAAIDHGVRDLLRALRNGGHGLGRGSRSQDALVTLMGHRADVSPDLPELVWFHLVRMLCFARWAPRNPRPSI